MSIRPSALIRRCLEGLEELQICVFYVRTCKMLTTKRIGSALAGLLGLAAFLVIGIAITAVYLYGVPRVALVIYKIANPLSGIVLLIDLLLLPFTLWARARALIGPVLLVSSYLFGIILWSYSAGMAFVFWGYAGLFFGLIWLGVGVVPVALLASALNSAWTVFGNIILGLVLTFGFRFLALFIGGKIRNPRAPQPLVVEGA